jgi:ATP-dependent DNA helicase RecQ
MTRNDGEQLLKTALSDPTAQFRDGQWEAIDALVNQRQKLLVVQRTGWGKSSVYFISTRILRDLGMGLTIIISPLLALMRNQIEAANRLGIRAITMNSSNRDDWEQAKQEVLADRVDCLLISPERLANDGFVDEVLQPIAERIGLMVVDEAHCISDWGHDFRPDYRRIVNILRLLPVNTAVLGTTATANDRVVTDILDQLGEIVIQRGPLVRESLALQTLPQLDQASRLAWLAQHIPHLNGTGIVYALTQNDAEQVADWLMRNGIEAAAYHSKITHPNFPDTSSYRHHLEDRLLQDDLKVLVATGALGMGYDKPNLGFVIHYQAPGSIVAYYQQVGRAGRAIDHALGVLLSGSEDEDIHAFFRRSAFPSPEQVEEVLEAVSRFDGLSVPALERHTNLAQGEIEKVLRYLSVESPAPLIKVGSQWRRTPVHYQLDEERILRLTELREQEWQQVQEYLQERGCLMAFLSEALDDPETAACGRCANCLGEAIAPGVTDAGLVHAAATYTRQAEMPITPRKQTASGAFQRYGFPYRLPPEIQAQEGRVLSRWRDAGWGQRVADGKTSNHFDDTLVDAMMDMIANRWRPEPAPTWVCCVPSFGHPDLVPDFARRVAARLNIPFLDAVHKTRHNQAQKLQRNSFHQCQNLDGVFEIVGAVPNGPVLLLDDMVDSGWTLTVIAALLRQAGSGPVYPTALSSTASHD